MTGIRPSDHEEEEESLTPKLAMLRSFDFSKLENGESLIHLS
jgi:hypothetical protein